ncbi:deazaflavin-dependent oxidoreductase (nitroreductase family) [Nonomuraea muscovyensis]|uniref:Deazaflavin-dependent oxidoreductase (Nitroreductase family) n=1 Tax=Nonomuraea muscovyensis TaxID=1124761 RepID=A0A7X0EWJ2_9ACTN|nr:nitroreductase family deazaflavin-dependent oxidoreductase [Nonomuraea muscovyensis]MBB6343686.1 deazaflavin-dependent oxidoreductase (nitroreductase family) [Nonomuraea muscovyensis]
MNQEPIDSPTGWVARHVKSYAESGGARGHLFHGAPTLLITTIGRRSGLPRRTALIYGRDGDRYLVVASNGGAADHPLWFSNLLAQPQVGVQVAAEVFDAVARPATADERPRLWETMTGIWPHYTGYQRQTPREIPVVIIERAATPDPGARS